MKVLITGNMGYIGPVVVEHLRRVWPNSTLHGFDSGYFATALVEPSILPERLLDAQFFGDVRQFPKGLLDGVDAVICLAAISNDPMGNAFEKVTYEINANAVIHLAELARAAKVKNFVFASSCSMYGYAEGGARSESDALNPLTAYAKSKVQAEEGLKKLATPDFTITCLRFATACGFSPRLRLDLVLNDFVACALVNKKIEILSDGTPWRPLIHVRDMARAIEWASLRSAQYGGEFLAVNTGSNAWNYQVKELAEAVRAEIPGVEISINPNAAPDKRSYKVSFDLFAKLAPEHVPKITLPEAVRELRDGLTRAGFATANFRESQFIRLKVLSSHKEAGRLDADLFWKN
ncbi:MAG: NAD-dependent epimerase/dehydratase family protein [Turneriella sp.]|nr:NAD-dependent epimerase/dehydratase family protein [Turneriella sp.]